MQGINIVYQIMLLNILFIVFSLPILTMGASSKALTACIRDLMKGDLNKEIRTFFHYFRKDFLKTTGFFLILLFAYTIVTINVINFSHIGWWLTLIQIPVIIQIVLLHAMLNYVLIAWDVKGLRNLKIAWILGNRNIIKVIGSLFFAYLLLKLGLRMPFIMLFFYAPLVTIIFHLFNYPTIQKTIGA